MANFGDKKVKKAGNRTHKWVLSGRQREQVSEAVIAQGRSVVEKNWVACEEEKARIEEEIKQLQIKWSQLKPKPVHDFQLYEDHDFSGKRIQLRVVGPDVTYTLWVADKERVNGGHYNAVPKLRECFPLLIKQLAHEQGIVLPEDISFP